MGIAAVVHSKDVEPLIQGLMEKKMAEYGMRSVLLSGQKAICFCSFHRDHFLQTVLEYFHRDILVQCNIRSISHFNQVPVQLGSFLCLSVT